MPESTIDTFFYGLFMDEAVLRQSGVEARAPRKAFVAGYRLRIGQRATMVRDFGAGVYGMVFAVTHTELDRLYAGPGLEGYRAEGVLAHLVDGSVCAASAYNVVALPEDHRTNPGYAERLRAVLSRLGFPEVYVRSVV